MGFVKKVVKKVVGGVKNIVTGAVDAVVNVVDWAVDKVIEPVVKGVGSVIKYVADNPIEAIAKVALTLTGQAWAIPLLDGALVVAKGGNIGDAVKAAAISYAGGKLGATAGQYASAAVTKATGSAIVGQIVGQGTKSATTALVYGQDPLKAFATGGIQAAMGAALGAIDNKMEGSFAKLQDGAKDTIFAGLAAELEGGKLSETQLGGIISKYTGVGDFMDKFLTTNAGLSGAQAAVVTSAVMSSVSTALAGNPQLSGAAFFREFSKAGAEDLKNLIDKPVNNAIDRISGAHNSAQAKAKLLNDATNNAATSAEKYNGVQATIAARITEQDRLRGVYNQKLAAFNTNKSEAGANQVNAASKAYNDYAAKLQTDYNNSLKPQLDAYQADFNKWKTQLPGLEKSYGDAMAYIVTKTEDLDTELKPILSAADKAVALTLSPTFDEAAYRKANGLSATTDVYSHYLSQGQNLPTSKAAIAATLSDMQVQAMEQSLAAKGIDVYSLDSTQLNAVMAYTTKNLTSTGAITGTDFNAFADKLIFIAKNTSPGPVTDYKKTPGVKATDIANGDARLTSVDGELKWVLASKIAESFGGQVVNSKMVAAPTGGNPNALRLIVTEGNTQTNTVTPQLVSNFKPGKSLTSMVTDARDNNSFSATLTKTIVGLGDEAGRLLDTYVKEPIYESAAKIYNYYLKDTTAAAALQNTTSIVTGAAGELLQAVAGLSVLAGNNPNNAIGRMAKNLLAISGDVQSDAWKAGAADMQKQSQEYDVQWRKDNPGKEPSKWQKAQLKAESIWGNIQDHPVQFIAENIVGELLQEIPIFLASGGVGNVAKAALLRGGAAYSTTIATKVAGTKVATALGLDMAEAFGGTAASAFDETYATAIKMGKSEQAATDIAMETAKVAGTTAMVLVGVTAGFGGQALAKSFFGDNASDYTVSGLNILAKKVTEGAKVSVKEGVTEFVEEALPQLVVATVNSQMDPSYDVAGSVWENGFLGAISGTGVAASLYSGDQVADAAVRLNSGVKTALSTAKNPTEATAALKKLGFTDNVVLNNMLNSTYDTMYVSTNEASKIFATASPGFNPTTAEVNRFVAQGSPESRQQYAAYVAAQKETGQLPATSTGEVPMQPVGPRPPVSATPVSLLDLGSIGVELSKLIFSNAGNVDAAIAQLANDLGTTEAGLLAEIGTTKSQITKDLGALENKLTTLIYDNKGDVDAALTQLAKDLGTTEAVLLTQIGLTKNELVQKIGSVSEDVGKLANVVGAPAVADNPNTAANEARDPTGLFATMQAYEDAGLSRDEALNAAIGDVSTALGIAKSDLLAAVEDTETTLSGQISDVESSLGSQISDVESSLGSQISDVEASLGADIQTVADFVGKPARNVTQTDIDFVIDLIAQGNISQELTSQYDVTGDGLIDINDQTTLESYLQGTPDVALDPNSIFNPATGLYLQQEQDTKATQDLNTELNTQTNKNIDMQAQNILTQMEEGQRKENIKDMYQMIEQSGDASGQRVDVTAPEKMNINYLYDFNSIFANPSQEGLFASPYGGSTRGRGQPGNGAPSLAPQFSAGGQVEDETDMLLRLLGDM